MANFVTIGAAVNDHRIGVISRARSIEDAQRMGIWDKLKNWWRGGVKLAAIKCIFEALFTVRESDKDSISDEGLMRDFALLRCSARPEYAARAAINICVNPRNETWNYTLTLGDEKLVGRRVSAVLGWNDGLTLAAFCDYQAILGLLHYLDSRPDANPDADRFPSCLQLHDKLMEMNRRRATIEKLDGLWKPEFLADKHKMILETLEQVGLPCLEGAVCRKVVHPDGATFSDPFEEARQYQYAIGDHSLNFLPSDGTFWLDGDPCDEELSDSHRERLNFEEWLRAI